MKLDLFRLQTISKYQKSFTHLYFSRALRHCSVYSFFSDAGSCFHKADASVNFVGCCWWIFLQNKKNELPSRFVGLPNRILSAIISRFSDRFAWSAFILSTASLTCAFCSFVILASHAALAALYLAWINGNQNKNVLNRYSIKPNFVGFVGHHHSLARYWNYFDIDHGYLNPIVSRLHFLPWISLFAGPCSVLVHQGCRSSIVNKHWLAFSVALECPDRHTLFDTIHMKPLDYSKYCWNKRNKT